MNNNNSFDPLSLKYSDKDIYNVSIKREIDNILNSYVGWFDPFCELIQNALDAVNKRAELESEYSPKIHILIDLKNDMISVSDNGIGMTEREFKTFLAPSISYKKGNTRGHKGVGATYLAYGFNYFQVATKTKDFNYKGIMVGARNWVKDYENNINPKLVEDNAPVIDTVFNSYQYGTTMTIKCEPKVTMPGKLNWLCIKEPKAWLDILKIKTALGQIYNRGNVNVSVDVIDENGNELTQAVEDNPQYLTIADFKTEESIFNNKCRFKVMRASELKDKEIELYRLKGIDFTMPSKYTNLEAIWDKWGCEDILNRFNWGTEKDEIREIIEKYQPTIIFSYVYSVKIWDTIDNDIFHLRKGTHALYGGIQIAANNMPQGELILIPLTKAIGRQKQANILIHFNNCSADLGRKGFRKEIVDISKKIAVKLMADPLNKLRKYFKKNSGAGHSMQREAEIDTWKEAMLQHEKDHPLALCNPNFFKPVENISITAIPTREQDVIALFNQLIAGGVIRGVKIMSTNERNRYDGLFRIEVTTNKELQIYDKEKNPLGLIENSLPEKVIDGQDFLSSPKVLEYKYSLDGLIEELDTCDEHEKSIDDIDLIVAWESGDLYKDIYAIESLLIEPNIEYRMYHGITHRLIDPNTNHQVCNIILLSDLIQYLNNPKKSIEEQLRLYDN